MGRIFIRTLSGFLAVVHVQLRISKKTAGVFIWERQEKVKHFVLTTVFVYICGGLLGKLQFNLNILVIYILIFIKVDEQKISYLCWWMFSTNVVI